MNLRPTTFEQARARYVHRYTIEHVPAWALTPCGGKYYAPQFSSDRERYDNTLFPGEGHVGKRAKYCSTSGQTWPRGNWLSTPFMKGA